MPKGYFWICVSIFVLTFLALAAYGNRIGLDLWRSFIFSSCLSLALFFAGIVGYMPIIRVIDSMPETFDSEILRVAVIVSGMFSIFCLIFIILLELSKRYFM